LEKWVGGRVDANGAKYRMVKHWHRFSGEEVDASSLETFRVRLAGALSSLI